MDYLATLKTLLGITDNSQDTILNIVIEEVVNLVLGYCHIDTIPTKLDSFVPIMAADMYRRKGYGQEEAPEHIKSVTQGKRSVSMESEVFDTDAFLKEYESRLRPFRVMKGRVPSELD